MASRGLDRPFQRAHASAGLDATFNHLQHALDYVAAHTPGDTETTRLEAVVTYWDNGCGPFKRTLVSVARSAKGR